MEYGRHVGQLRRRRRAYAPTSNTASQDNHEKINSWVSVIFPLHDEYGAPLGGPWGRRSSATNVLAGTVDPRSDESLSAHSETASPGVTRYFELGLTLHTGGTREI